MLHSFPPVIDERTELLVIGSMPGVASLTARQYYAYKHNQFWRLMFELLEHTTPPENYDLRLQTLLKHRIGLWDALADCERPGSLDAQITRGIPNDFPTLFTRYPQVHTLLFNGQTARRYFKQAYGDLGRTCILLPSTSPAHASLSYEAKKQRWATALTVLHTTR